MLFQEIKESFGENDQIKKEVRIKPARESIMQDLRNGRKCMKERRDSFILDTSCHKGVCMAGCFWVPGRMQP